ncbi:MAG: 6-bladed beta-propeller [Desulfuromonadaceae bacterium]|nr:6-bladed beta-propeller [Desulfuromonadaceae bacterium]
MAKFQMVRPTKSWFMTRLFALFTALSGLAACATGQPAPSITQSTISWPLANTQNRVVWVKNITGPADIKNKSGFWLRLQEVVNGAEKTVIDRPHGLLRSAAGALYLADPGRGVVHCLDITNGAYSTIGGRDDAPLRSPIGLAEDNSGRVYITDSMTGMVYRFTPGDGTLKPLLQQALERPTGIAFNPVNKRLYVTDTMASQIVVIEQNGFIQRRIGSRGDGNNGFNRPTDIAIDSRGQMYVTDSLNFRVTVMTPEGQTLHQFGSPGDTGGTFSRPKGIAVDSAGNIYVNDSLMDTVQVFNQNGALQLMFGKKGSDPGQFWMPSGLFIDRLDQIYVADTYNRRIQIFRYLAHSDDVNETNDADLFDKPLSPAR